jgi:glutathione S-transferase
MKYTLIVGTKEWSSWSLRPYLALRHVGVPFDEIVVPLRATATSPEILRYSPTGRVPVLQAGTRTIWDSLAICEALNDFHPKVGLWPRDPLVRAEARAYAAEMHSGFPDLRDQLSMEFARRLPLPQLRDATKAQIARVVDAWEATLARYRGVGDYLFGRFSIADCMYAPVVSRFTTYGVEVPKRSRAYMEAIWALPAMQDWRKAAQEEIDAGLA